METVIRASEKDIKADSSTANEYVKAETKQLWSFLLENKKNYTHDNKEMTTISEFTYRLIQSGRLIDIKRLWSFTFSMIGIGVSFGITAPAFPFLVQNLGLTTGEYGMIVSAFALKKLFGYVPFAVLVEQHGR